MSHQIRSALASWKYIVCFRSHHLSFCTQRTSTGQQASDFSVSRVVREALHEEFADGQYHVLRATYLGRHPEAPLSPTLSTSTSWQTATFDSVGKPLKSASQSTGGILGGGSMVGARRRDSESDLDPDTVEKPPRPHRDLLQ